MVFVGIVADAGMQLRAVHLWLLLGLHKKPNHDAMRWVSCSDNGFFAQNVVELHSVYPVGILQRHAISLRV